MTAGVIITMLSVFLVNWGGFAIVLTAYAKLPPTPDDEPTNIPAIDYGVY